MPTVVRPAAATDVPALLALLAELHPADPAVPAEIAQEVWLRLSKQDGRTVLVADSDGSLAGTVDCAVLPNLTRGARPSW